MAVQYFCLDSIFTKFYRDEISYGEIPRSKILDKIPAVN